MNLKNQLKPIAPRPIGLDMCLAVRIDCELPIADGPGESMSDKNRMGLRTGPVTGGLVLIDWVLLPQI